MIREIFFLQSESTLMIVTLCLVGMSIACFAGYFWG